MFKNKTLILTLIFAIVLGAIAYDVTKDEELGETKISIDPTLILESDKGDVLYSTTTDEIVRQPDGKFLNIGKKKYYAYDSGNKVIADKWNNIDEDVSRRTFNTRYYKIRDIVDEKGNPVRDSKGRPLEEWHKTVYGGVSYYKKTPSSDWTEVNYATTTPEAFDSQMAPTAWERIKMVFGQQVYADDSSYFSGEGDGDIFHSGITSDWDTAHDATDGNVARPTQATGLYCAAGKDGSGKIDLIRVLLPFLTAAEDEDAVYSAGSVSLYVTFLENPDDDGNDFANIVGQTTQPSNTTFTTADYDLVAAVDNPTQVATALDLTTDITVDQYNVWTLNATGLSQIVTDGYTKFGCKIGNDINDHPYAGSNGALNRVQFSASEQDGTSEDPKLDLTFTVAAAGAPPATGPEVQGGWWQ